jgi:predicted DsbA family dithiol-disulfide isomerase
MLCRARTESTSARASGYHSTIGDVESTRMSSTVLRLYSDFVCPFCFIAEHSTLPRLREEFDLAVEWCGFELHPGTPRGGMALSALFPPARLPAVRAHMQQFAARFGVTGMNHPDHIPNTRRALAIAELARDQARLDPFRQSAMVGYWCEGLDLEKNDDLRVIAERAGLLGGDALAAADDPAFHVRVGERQADARRHGVTGIPTFFIGSEAVVGCHPYDVLATAARRAGARPRLRSVAQDSDDAGADQGR